MSMMLPSMHGVVVRVPNKQKPVFFVGTVGGAAPPARPLCPGRAIPGYAVLEEGQGLFGVHDAGIIIPCGVEEAGELSGWKRGVQ